MDVFEQSVLRVLLQAGVPEPDAKVEVPPEESLGDFAFPCFVLSKSLKKNPVQLAQDLTKIVKPQGPIERVEAQGPYVNFFIDRKKMAAAVLPAIIEQGLTFGSSSAQKDKVVIEYPAPNTNKPLHLGHVRNMLLGNSLCNILAFAGHKVVPVDLVNDRGIHICKSMVAYNKWGFGREADKKPDHFVADFYVMFSQKAKDSPELDTEAAETLRLWESNDPATVELWKKMREWALQGISQTYADFDVHHAKTYYESDIYESGKEIILSGLAKGVFEKDDTGAVIVDLEKFGLGKKVLLRSDGTSIYITQDIFLAKQKFEDFAMDRSVHIVGSEQLHHFKVLFKVLELLGYSFAPKCYHLAYGMIYLPQGRMKSREGTVVDADDLLEEMLSVAAQEIRKRHELDETEVKRRSRVIAMGAIKFFMLKYDALKDFTYNPEESISFDGETGPYVQYAHARICSILRQVDMYKPKASAYKFEHPREHRLIYLLSKYPQVCSQAAAKYAPSLVARYLLDLSQAFNEFYQECPVLKGAERDDRLALVWCTRTVLASALDLLGIKSPEEM